MDNIHATAIVASGAKLGEGVRIGPYCVVGSEVEMGDGVVLHSHVVVDGRTKIGARTQVFPFASLGHRPQDLKFHGEVSDLVIGADNMIREHVTMNPGTEGGGLLTKVGDKCLFMMSSHVAHDCIVGDRVILANNATLGGHVVVEDEAIIGGLSAVHQFVRIGRGAMIGGMSGIEHDVIPYGLAMGERATLHGLNVVGLKRRGYERGVIKDMNEAYDRLFRDEKTLAERVDALVKDYGDSPGVRDIVSFLQSGSSRALCRPKQGRDG
jgi:UDP-N-acetylglucosamine acyltransferase